MIVRDDLIVLPGDDRELGHLHGLVESVEGEALLAVRPGARFSAPGLTRVTGTFEIGTGAIIYAPNLVSVGQLLVEGATVSLPALDRVPYALVARAGSTVAAPALRYVRVRLVVEPGAWVVAPALQREARMSTLSVAPGATLIGPNGAQAWPGDTWRNFWRRVDAAPLARMFSATRPHARCGRSKLCLEHEQDRRVQSCKRRGRFSKE